MQIKLKQNSKNEYLDVDTKLYSEKVCRNLQKCDKITSTFCDEISFSYRHRLYLGHRHPFDPNIATVQTCLQHL